MENKIYHVALKEIVKIKELFKKEKRLFIAEIDGSAIQDKEKFLHVMNETFDFPIPANGFDGFNDWIRDLDWLEKDGYVLIVYSYNEFLAKDQDTKSKIINLFKELILPFWEEEVKHCVVDGQPKPFNVYLVD